MQDALAIAPPIEVWVAAGTYKPDRGSGNRNLSFRIGVDPPPTAVYGGFSGVESARGERDPAAHIVVLSGDLLGNDASGFANRGDNSGTVVILFGNGFLDGVTIRGGNDSSGNGGALSLNAGVVRGCAFTDNQSGVHGGAIGGGSGAAGGLPLAPDERLLVLHLGAAAGVATPVSTFIAQALSPFVPGRPRG